jgi:hypothetical protein
MTRIVKWAKFVIPLKFIILMTSEAIMFFQSKQQNGFIILKNITNIPMDPSI